MFCMLISPTLSSNSPTNRKMKAGLALQDGELEGGTIQQIHWTLGGDGVPQQVLVSEFNDPAPQVDTQLPGASDLCALHTAIVPAWQAVVASHSLSFDEHIYLIGNIPQSHDSLHWLQT